MATAEKPSVSAENPPCLQTLIFRHKVKIALFSGALTSLILRFSMQAESGVAELAGLGAGLYAYIECLRAHDYILPKRD
ncbi:MAG TPA: hypothetical protein VIT68_01695 [Candidatus Gracilibacteria bacterium]